MPSVTETLGNVILEAIACGLPVAGFPAPGLVDLIEPNVNGFYHTDLAYAIQQCLTIDRKACAESGSRFTSKQYAEQFLQALIPAK